MSDAVAAQLITAVIALLGTIFSGIMAFLMAKLNIDQKARADAAAIKVQEVKEAAATVATQVDEVKTTLASVASDTGAKMNGLATLTSDTNAKLGEVHKLVDGAMGVQLKLTAIALRRVADLTKHPDDVKAAVLAEKIHADHEANQPGPDAPAPAAPAGHPEAVAVTLPVTLVAAPADLEHGAAK